MGDIRAGLEDIKLDEALFADVKYYVSGEAEPKIISLLQKGGAERCNYFSSFVTHLIAGYEALETDICQAKELYEIPAVTHDWVTISAQCKKLLPTKYFSAEENQLFSMVRACISQVSLADSKALWGMITLQGGKCQLRLDRFCTHLIVTKPSGSKFEAATRHHMKIVTPDWVVDCSKKRAIVPEAEYHPRLLVQPSPNSSTALITGFMDNTEDNGGTQGDQDRTKVMLEQLKQRMPWNQSNPPANVPQSSPSPQGINQQIPTSSPNLQQPQENPSPVNSGQITLQVQRQASQFRNVSTPSVTNYSTPVVSTNQTPSQNPQSQNWHQQIPQVKQQIQSSQQQQQEQLSQGQVHVQQLQQQMPNQNPQQSLPLPQVSNQINQQMQMQVSFPQQLMPQQSPQMTSPSSTQGIAQIQQQMMPPQQNLQMSHQTLIQQKPVIQHQMPQQVNPQPQLSPLPQSKQVNSQQGLNQGLHGHMQQQQIPQQPQPMVSQSQVLPQQTQMIQQSQNLQQSQMVQQPQSMPQQSPQPILQQNQIPQQIGLQQQLPNQQTHQQQQLPQEQRQLIQQLPNQQPHQQQLTPEQRQQLLALQQQQKIQQISQQLQQSAPQPSQQFIIRDGQLQQQAGTQIINQSQSGFIVNREVWQQQQYHLQLQRQQQQQQQLGQPRPGGQWTQQPPQPPRQLIQLDAQTHQQLQQMDPQQRAQFIQKIQKQRNILLQRQMQNRTAQGPHGGVIRASAAPGQPGLQWVQQRPQMMTGVTSVAGQKPLHPGVQPPALTPINSSNQVIVPSGQPVPVQSPQAAGQPFQQGQLTPQQIAQLHLQKQQHLARLQQLQHLQQSPQQSQPQVQPQSQPQPQQSPQQPQQTSQTQSQPQPQPLLQSPSQSQPQQSPVQSETPLTSLPGNSQMPPDQQLVVNAKTKTALANMLTNRLQGGAAEGSAAGQLRLMTAQHRPPPPPSQDPALLAAYQRRSLGNITNGAAQGPMKMQYAPAMAQPKAQFYGHNPNLKLPPDLFLLGCIFVIVEYESQYSTAEVSHWKRVIERHGGEVEPQYCARATHVLAITQKHPIVVQALREGKRCVSAHWLSDVVGKQQVVPPWHALHFPIPYGLNELPCSKQNMSFSGFEGEERVKIKGMLDVLEIKYTTYFSHHNTLLITRRPDGPKYKKAREWQISVVNAQWLTDVICGQVSAIHQIDAPKYQQFNASNPFRLDYSLVPHLMAAWKMPINITQESYDKVKQVGQGPNAMRKHKKPRLDGPLLNKDPHLLGLDEPVVISNPDPPTLEKQPRILFSGTNPAKYAKRIRELGGALAASWRDATHLVMPAAFRTVKLLCCLSRVKCIVNIQWLLDCFGKNTFIDESSYILGDAEFEKNFHCNIEKALASPNRGAVLKGLTFYVTPSVVPSPTAFSEIIESAGGTMEKSRRSLVQIQEMNSGGKLNYIIVTQENDLHLLADVLQANILVFSAEVVLRSVARQNFHIDTNQL
ncbi:PAX-interacting protein 1 [Diachasmimorpha longicaudata]|uniref:PAX-interacting protein 1 n=1 Tax=Diachasmimorpha longicaudata TaxID=58733 RepID=UPI0030B86A2C